MEKSKTPEDPEQLYVIITENGFITSKKRKDLLKGDIILQPVKDQEEATKFIHRK